jgi:excisionase family DNA binding protein
MKSRRASARRVKINLNYTPEEAAALTGAHKNTVLRWIGTGALPALTDCRPYLVLGKELVAFLSRKSTGSAKLQPGQCYCVKCKQPQYPALGMAEFMPVNEHWGNLRGICPTCETLMYRRTSCARLPEIRGSLDITFLERGPRIVPCTIPSTNVDSGAIPNDQAKSLSR